MPRGAGRVRREGAPRKPADPERAQDPPGPGPARAAPARGGRASGPGGTGATAAATAGAASAAAQARGGRAAGAGPGTTEGDASGGSGSALAAEAEGGGQSATGQDLLAVLASRKAGREQTIEALIQRLEQEAASGSPAAYEWVASRLEAAAGQAISDDRLEEALAIVGVFLRHRQTGGLKPAVRERAAQAVQTVAGDEALAYLVGRLGPGAAGSAEELSAVLVGLGPRVVPPLLDRLTLADQGEVRAALVATLARLLEVAQAEVTGALQQAGRDQAAQLAVNIGQVGAEAGVGLLAPLARHRDARVRCEAVRALGRIGGASVHRHLMQALRDPHPVVLEVAVGFVGTAKVKLATPILLRLAGQRTLTGQPFAVRKAAVAALGAMGDPGSISILTGLLYTRTWFKRAAGDELRQTAALALLGMGRPEARQVVEEGARSHRKDVRRACDAALRRLADATPGRG